MPADFLSRNIVEAIDLSDSEQEANPKFNLIKNVFHGKAIAAVMKKSGQYRNDGKEMLLWQRNSVELKVQGVVANVAIINQGNCNKVRDKAEGVCTIVESAEFDDGQPTGGYIDITGTGGNVTHLAPS